MPLHSIACAYICDLIHSHSDLVTVPTYLLYDTSIQATHIKFGGGRETKPPQNDVDVVAGSQISTCWRKNDMGMTIQKPAGPASRTLDNGYPIACLLAFIVSEMTTGTIIYVTTCTIQSYAGIHTEANPNPGPRAHLNFLHKRSFV